MNLQVSLLVLLVLVVTTLVQYIKAKYSVHFVTYNVKNNDWMPRKAINKQLVNQLLDVTSQKQDELSHKDIYIVTLQENCFQCNTNNLPKVAKLFEEQLRAMNPEYKMVALASTRESSLCETVFCSSIANQHGTTLIMAFVRGNLVQSFTTRRINKCSKKVLFLYNEEKGLVGIQLKMQDQRRLCFIGGHLDPNYVENRQKCVANFFEKGDERDMQGRSIQGSNWLKTCDAIFIGGDLNTRTGEKKDKNPPGSPTELPYLQSLIVSDEFSGSKPYNNKGFLKYLQQFTGLDFREPLRPIFDNTMFMATYSLQNGPGCSGSALCYKPDHRISWTDRIACYKCGDVQYYSSLRLPVQYSDHLPVVAICNNL